MCMKARMLTRTLGVLFSAALLFASPVFAHSAYSSGHVNHDYSYRGRFDYAYGTSWYGGRDYAYGGYETPGHARSPYSGDRYSYGGYGHPSGTFGYWSKDARHHDRRGHHHHHWF